MYIYKYTMMPNMKRHGADMLWNVGTCEEIEGGIKERLEGDTGRRIETDISTFYIQACSYIQTCLTHNCSFTQRQYHTHIRFHIHIQTHTQTHLHTQMFLQTISPTIPFTRRCFYTQTLWHTQRFHTQTLLRAYPFTHKHFYTNTFTHRTLYTHTHTPLSHTHKHVYLAMLPMECHFEPLFGWVMLLQPKKECHGILHAEKQSASLFSGIVSKWVHCARASLRQTRLTCSVWPHARMQPTGDQKEACASTSLKQFRLTCLLQLHTQMPKK